MVSTASSTIQLSQYGSLPAKTKGMGTILKSAKKSVMGNFGLLFNGALLAHELYQAKDAFSLEYDSDGKKVEGTNWSAGLKESAKTIARFAGFCTATAVIGGPGGLVAGLLISPLLEDLLPKEQTVVEQACARNGIKYKA